MDNCVHVSGPELPEFCSCGAELWSQCGNNCPWGACVDFECHIETFLYEICDNTCDCYTKTIFFSEIDDIVGDRDFNQAQICYAVILDNLQEDVWFFIRVNQDIRNQIDAVIQKYYPSEQYHYKIWCNSAICAAG